MWTKISHAFKARGADADAESSTAGHSQGEVMSHVYEQHPNLSVFHSAADAPPSVPSPPASPSKKVKRSVFKRKSHIALDDGADAIGTASSFKLSLVLPKKVKESLQLNANHSEVSLTSSNADQFAGPSADTLPLPPPPPPKEDPFGPLPSTPTTDAKYGSLRSILRDRNTPATGRSVRFFSRDAYKVISDESGASLEPEQSNLATLAEGPATDKFSPDPPRLRSPPRSVRDVFPASSTASPADASKSIGSLFIGAPMAPPDFSNIFDMSAEHQVPAIPLGDGLLDNAVEVSEADAGDHEHVDDEDAATAEEHVRVFPAAQRHSDSDIPRDISEGGLSSSSGKSPHDRSQSFSFGQTVFHSLANVSRPLFTNQRSEASILPAVDPKPVFRSRAQSETAFHSFGVSTVQVCRSPSPNVSILNQATPETDINDMSSSDLQLWASPAPDPFRANATTYYTPQTLIAQTPPEVTMEPFFCASPDGSVSSLSVVRSVDSQGRRISHEEDAVFSLRTQLALQQELCKQYEIDLGARDELVAALKASMANGAHEAEKRRSALRAWKKKVAELERACRYLEEEVDRSQQDSMNRSVLEEASGEALRMLHQRINALEGEKRDAERTAEHLQQELEERLERERKLKAGIEDARNEVAKMADDRDDQPPSTERDQDIEEERERHQATERAWLEERANLESRVDEIQETLQTKEEECARLTDLVAVRDEQLVVLKAELEAHWAHTEEAGGQMEALRAEHEAAVHERDVLREEAEGFERRMSEMEVEWTESENRRAELEDEVQSMQNAREESERDREELETQLEADHAQLDGLARTLQEREDRIVELTQESQYASETIARLEENVRQRDAEVGESTQRVAASEEAVEELREHLSRAKRDHARVLDEQARELQEIRAREAEARAQTEALLRDQAEGGVRADRLEERSGALQAELDKLRRQVHELQQESADKDLRIAQIGKQRAQDKEDLDGLNIALDSKQQELELMKRKIGVRGTAGSTPAPNKVAHHRRDSSIFTTPTPNASRPPSSMSESSQRERKLIDTPSNSSLKNSAKPLTSSNLSSSSSGAGSTAKKVAVPRGSMGPPPMKPRVSAIGTPTPAAHSRIPSSSTAAVAARLAGAKSPPSAMPVRRTASVLKGRESIVSPTPSDKENATPARRMPRMSATPTPS